MPSIGKKLWKSAETNTKRQRSIERYVRDAQNEKALPAVRIAAVVPTKLEEVVKAAAGDAKVDFLKVKDLRASAVKDLDAFYNSHILILDHTDSKVRPLFSYRLGVRQTIQPNGKQGVVILFEDKDPESNIGAVNANYPWVGYQETEAGLEVSNKGSNMPLVDYLTLTLKTLSESAPILSTREQHWKEDLKKAQSNTLNKQERLNTLGKLEAAMKRDPNMMTVGHILDLMLAYRELSSWGNISRLYNSLDRESAEARNSTIRYNLAFALNRRNEVASDRTMALQLCEELLRESTDGAFINEVEGLLGRIHKDKFIESLDVGGAKDYDSCEEAIKCYKKAFENENSLYHGVNLLTLMFASESYQTRRGEIESICMKLNHQIAATIGVKKITDYWEAASLFEINTVAENYHLANEAATVMLHLAVHTWMTESTMRNIQLIDRLKKQRLSAEMSMDVEDVSRTLENDSARIEFEFWCEFFMMAGKDDVSRIRFPVLYQNTGEPRYAHITLHPGTDTDGATIDIEFVVPEPVRKFDVAKLANVAKIDQPFQHDDQATDKRRLALAVRGDHGVPLFTITFSSEAQREQFLDLCIKGGYDVNKPESTEWNQEAVKFKWEYEDVNGHHRILGTGATATVYAGINIDTGEDIAIKVVQLDSGAQVPADIRDELRTLQHLQHKNIVKFLGVADEDQPGVVRLLMELVPGGSVTRLLTRFGPLWNSKYLADYAFQILSALHYLHNADICHRDVKGDNVLVNTYSGVLKIADFGTSKRMAGLNTRTDSLKGTPWFMAPEVIQSNTHDYGRESDIWSFGCTVWQMAMGRPPFVEIRDHDQVLNIVGVYRDTETIPDDWPAELRTLIRSCWNLTPSERPSAALLLSDPFFRSLAKGQLEFRSKAESGDDDGKHSMASLVIKMRRPTLLDTVVPGGDTTKNHRSICDLFSSLFEKHSESLCRGWIEAMIKEGLASQDEAAKFSTLAPAILKFIGSSLNAVGRGVVQDPSINGVVSLFPEHEKRMGFERSPTMVFIKQMLSLLRPRRYDRLFLVDVLRNQKVEFPPHNIFCVEDTLTKSSEELVDQLKSCVFGHSSTAEQIEEVNRRATEHSRALHSTTPSLEQHTVESSSSTPSPPNAGLSMKSELVAYAELNEQTQRLLREILETKRLLNDQLKHDLVGARRSLGVKRVTIDDKSDVTVASPPVDRELLEFIVSLGLSQSIAFHLAEEKITLDILLNAMDKDDLKDVGLPIGPRCVIWKELSRRRGGSS